MTHLVMTLDDLARNLRRKSLGSPTEGSRYPTEHAEQRDQLPE